MNIFVRKSCLSLIVLSALIEIIQANKNESNTDARQARATGRIVKVYSGYKPSPIVCLDEGFKADPTDCSVFYRCVKASHRGNFNIFRYQCGPGTVYDPETEICNHPRNTKRSECGGIISSQENEDENEDNEVGHELPSPISTNLPFHISQSSPVLMSTTVNPLQLDILTKSTPKNYYHTTTTVKYEPPVPAYPWMGMSNETYQTLTTVTPLLDKSDPCISDGFIGDHENCRKFYRCVRNSHGSFTRHEFFCSDSTIWDDNIQSCNHAWAARNSRCGRNNDSFKVNQTFNDVTSQNIHQQFNYGLKTTENYNYSKNDVSNQVEYSSTVDFNKNTNIGNVVNNNNKSTNRQPNATSVINEETSKINEGLVIQYGNIEKQTTKAYFTEKNPQKVTQIQRGKSVECSQTGFMGDINDCSKFYRCVDSGSGKFIKYEFSCSQGTVWDSKAEACNHAWAVTECGGLPPIKGVSSTNILTAYGDSSPSSSKATTYKITTITTTADGLINENKPNQVEYSGSVDFNENSNSGYGINDYNSPSLNQPSNVNSIREETLITQYGNIEKQTTEVYSVENLPQKVTQMQGGISMECSKSGFMGDPNDCSKFYRCVDSGNEKFMKYEFSCSQGTVWDSKAEACNHTWAVKECGGLPPINGVSTTNTLTTTRDSSPSSKATTYKITTITTTNDDLINENNDNGYFNPIKVQEETTMPTTISLISTASTIQSIKECKETSFIGDENDCQIFYRCVDNGNGGFTKFEYKCGQGTLWDRNIEACNHAWAVKSCGSQSSTNIIETTKVSNKITTNSYIQATTISVIQSTEYNEEEKQTEKSDKNEINKVSKEPESYHNVCQNIGFIGDSNDCRKFYRCVDNGNGGFIQHQFLCGEGTVWDSSVEACNHAWAVKTCGANMETLEETQSSSQSTDSYNTTQNYQSTISSTEINSNDASSVTQGYNTQNTTARPISTTFSTTTISNTNECSRDGFAGDKYDCKKFYRCVINHVGGYDRYDFYCGDGTLWDPKIQGCNHEWAVKECSGNLSAASENNNNEMSKPTASSVEESENNYTSQSSPEPNNSTSSTTIRSPTPTMSTTLNKTGKCQSSGYIGDENDCKKFYRCVENDDGNFTAYEFTCGEGTVWDSKITACNHEWAVAKCNNNQNEQIKTTSNPGQIEEVQSSPTQVPTIDSTIGISSTTQMSNTSTTTSTTSTSTMNPSLEEEQKCISDGFFANKNDCKKFFRCVDNGKGSYNKYEFDCGEGTIWVQEIQACDHNTLGENCTSYLITTSSESHKVTSSTNAPNVSYTSSEAAIISTTDELEPNTDQAMAMICQNEGFFGNTEDCKKFYRCVSDGKGKFSKYDYNCGDGTIWDSEIIACNHPQDVSNPSCKSEHDNSSDMNGNHENTTTEKSTESIISTSKTTTTSISTEKESEKPPMSTTISSGIISGSSTTSVSTTSSTNCTNNDTSDNSDTQAFKCEKAGFYADKYDCKKFHRCVDWDGNGNKFSVFHFECGDGTIWDPALETCNHESSIIPPRNCNSPQQENVTQSTITTEKTTTIHSVTTQETTTQSSTTQPESSSSELSTTQSSSSEQSTTQSSSSEQSTTQASSSDQSTTQSSSSEQSTTQSSSSEYSTTQSSSSEQSTTQSSSSESSTTQSSTSELSTMQSSTEQSTTQSSSTEQSTIQLSTTEHLTTQIPVTSDTQATTTEPTTTTSNQEQTTRSTTEQASSTEQTLSTESTTESTPLTSISTDQTTTEPTNTSTEQSTTTEDNISQITEVQSTTSETISTESSTESSSQQKCPETDSDQSIFVCPTSFKRHPKYCNIFYQCVEDNDTHEVKVTVFNCPNNTIYDESKIQCVEEDKSDEKCNGNIAQKHRVKRLGSFDYEPISVTTQSMACSSAGHFPFEIQEECSEALLKCELTKSGKLRGFVYKCPKGYVYWKVSRRCESIRKVRDCKRSSYPWNSRYDLPLEKYNIAS